MSLTTILGTREARAFLKHRIVRPRLEEKPAARIGLGIGNPAAARYRFRLCNAVRTGGKRIRRHAGRDRCGPRPLPPIEARTERGREPEKGDIEIWKLVLGTLGHSTDTS